MGLMSFWITLLFGVILTIFGVSHYPTSNLWYFFLTLVGMIMILIAVVSIGGNKNAK